MTITKEGIMERPSPESQPVRTARERWIAWLVAGANGNPPAGVRLHFICPHCGSHLRCMDSECREWLNRYVEESK